MKVNISKSNLINAVNIASKAVPAKTTLPILECILIDASTEKIKFMANDEELGIETIQDGTILEHGIIAIDAAIFGNIVRKLPDGMDVTLETDGEQVTIRSGKIVFSISGRDGSDFPYLPEIDRSYSIEVSELTLRDIITKTIFAISTNDTNQLMTGELFEIRNREQLRVAALDGHRISVRSVELKESYEDKKVIIPGKTLTEISKILDPNPEEMVHVYLADKHAMFQFGTTTVVTRLIEGTYFNVDQMISGDYNTHVRINRQAFLSCLDRATLLVHEEDKKPIILKITDESLELRIRTAMGSMDENLSIEKEGSDIVIGFNPRLLMDALRAIDEDDVEVYFLSPRAPAFIRDESTYCYLILPVNFISYD